MKKWYYRTYPNEQGERFAVMQTWGFNGDSENIINFWHITPQHTCLYTIKPNKVYNRKVKWSEDLCRELLNGLKMPQPVAFVVRYVVDGQQIFSDVKAKVPKEPKAPKGPPAAGRPEKKTKAERIEIEAEKGKEPAPFILYGVHDRTKKEYAWWLTPDKPKRQGIEPGDRVLVWSQNKWNYATVTRIVPATGTEQLTARVKKKINPGEPGNKA